MIIQGQGAWRPVRVNRIGQPLKVRRSLRHNLFRGKHPALVIMRKYLAIPAVFAIIMVACVVYMIDKLDEEDLRIDVTQQQFETSQNVVRELAVGLNIRLVLSLYTDPESGCHWRIADPGDEEVVLNIEREDGTWTFLSIKMGQSQIRFVHGPPPGGGPHETYSFILKITVE